jgi:hypothetical protein
MIYFGIILLFVAFVVIYFIALAEFRENLRQLEVMNQIRRSLMQNAYKAESYLNTIRLCNEEAKILHEKLVDLRRKSSAKSSNKTE